MNRYRIDLIYSDGTSMEVEDARLADMEAVLERVSQTGCSIDSPGCRIRVKDNAGSVVFVGVTTGQGCSGHEHAA
jgi:hypothetical protein